MSVSLKKLDKFLNTPFEIIRWIFPHPILLKIAKFGTIEGWNGFDGYDKTTEIIGMKHLDINCIIIIASKKKKTNHSHSLHSIYAFILSLR